VNAAVELLNQNAAAIGLGEIYYGPTLALNYNVGGLDPGEDPRSPDIIVTPNVGVTYSGSTSMVGDHGGFAHDDTNVILLVANPSMELCNPFLLHDFVQSKKAEIEAQLYRWEQGDPGRRASLSEARL
jgi:hypothetical protein